MFKEFLPYEQALEIKELEFDKRCFGYYNNKKELTFNINSNPVAKDYIWVGNEIIPTDMILAPIFSQVFRWFRENYNIHQTIEYDPIDKVYMVTVGYDYIDAYNTYEEAELICIKKLIELLKNKL